MFSDIESISLRFGTLMRSLSRALLVSGRSFCIVESVGSWFVGSFGSVDSVRLVSGLNCIRLNMVWFDSFHVPMHG